jgi:predicted Holliday junction resolvase-like endonuclease
MSSSKKIILIVFAMVMGISFFVFQINETKKRMREDNFNLLPSEKLEKIFNTDNERKEEIMKIHEEKEEEINRNLITETEKLEEINNKENGTEKE